MCRHNETLSSGHKDAWRLVALHAAEQHVNGVSQAGEVGQALRGVEGEQLRVLQGKGHRQRGGGCHLNVKRRMNSEADMTFMTSICHDVMSAAAQVSVTTVDFHLHGV